MAVHWEYALPAYRTAPHVWNVGGQDNVCAFLPDSGEGLILIDTGLSAGTFYLVIDRIWRSGHDSRDIRKIFCTHYHGDHTANVRCLVELIGKKNVEVWMSREDEVQHQLTAEDTAPMYITPYTVTNFYDNSKPIVMGRFAITTRLTPGHTPGATEAMGSSVHQGLLRDGQAAC